MAGVLGVMLGGVKSGLGSVAYVVVIIIIRILVPCLSGIRRVVQATSSGLVGKMPVYLVAPGGFYASSRLLTVAHLTPWGGCGWFVRVHGVQASLAFQIVKTSLAEFFVVKISSPCFVLGIVVAEITLLLLDLGSLVVGHETGVVIFYLDLFSSFESAKADPILF